MAQSNTRLSPRQKMINLMYIVLTAMLALNVSSDVLDGFVQVHDGLARTNETVSERNDAVYAQLEAFAIQNPEKGGVWLARASEVRKESQKVFMLIDSLKMEVVKEVDGENADPNNIEDRENLEAAAVVMLNPATRNGAMLRGEIEAYRSYIQGFIVDSVKRDNIDKALSTAPFKQPGVAASQTWEESKFDNQPVVAAGTLLTKLQNDVGYAEGEALTTLLSQVDAGDVRVNSMNAFVIPQSRMVMRGSRYSADIVLAAVDTTARPMVYINGKEIENGKYGFTPMQSGSFDYSGYIEVPHGDGSTSRHDFSSSYTVMEPTATVSATMMNVLYAGINNPISISVPGVAASSVSASMTNGSLVKQGDHWIARPSAIGQDAVITVVASIDGHQQTVNTTAFRVRRLPDPVAYINIAGADGKAQRYKGSRPVAKAALLAAGGVGAAIDDDMLNIEFTVKSFETVFIDSQGDAAVRTSDGAKFSQQQKDRMRQMSRGKRFYISKIKAVGPDGTERILNPVEVIVN